MTHAPKPGGPFFIQDRQPTKQPSRKSKPMNVGPIIVNKSLSYEIRVRCGEVSFKVVADDIATIRDAQKALDRVRVEEY